MANIRRTDTLAETGPGIPDEALGPGEESAFETALARAEAEARQGKAEAHGRTLFGEQPDGIGPTLGQNLGQAQARAKPRPDADWNDEAYDPPT